MAYAQDIHLEDIELWQHFKEYWTGGQYATALAYLQQNSYQLSTKYLQAEILNTITNKIEELEENRGVPFKADRIVVSSTPPENMTSGQVYFQLN